MSNKSNARYAVIGSASFKSLKNALTREEARNWKRNTGKSGLRIFDRQRNAVIS